MHDRFLLFGKLLGGALWWHAKGIGFGGHELLDGVPATHRRAHRRATRRVEARREATSHRRGRWRSRWRHGQEALGACSRSSCTPDERRVAERGSGLVLDCAPTVAHGDRGAGVLRVHSAATVAHGDRRPTEQLARGVRHWHPLAEVRRKLHGRHHLPPERLVGTGVGKPHLPLQLLPRNWLPSAASAAAATATGPAMLPLAAPATARGAGRILQGVVHGRLRKGGLVLLQQFLGLRDRFPQQSRRWDILLLTPSILLAVGEGAERAPPAVRITAGASLVELRVVQLLLGAMSQGASHTIRASLPVVQFRGPVRDTACPARAWVRRVPDDGNPSPIAVCVRVHAALPVVRPSDRTPLRLEPEGDEFLRGFSLLRLPEVRHEQLLPCVGEGAEATTGATLRLVAKALAEELRVVEQLCGAVAVVALVTAGASALVVELTAAWFPQVAQLAPVLDCPAAVALAVEERATAVIVRGGWALKAAWRSLELADHPLDLLLVVLEAEGLPKGPTDNYSAGRSPLRGRSTTRRANRTYRLGLGLGLTPTTAVASPPRGGRSRRWRRRCNFWCRGEHLGGQGRGGGVVTHAL
mmetsp:Transcript_59961/g.131647  ORF Transcript_59961/g.131647 Transcript_59961/m.131647 type:complete len:584 (-) Transcript_59961:33-1784(-)